MADKPIIRDNPELTALIQKARDAYERMTPEQKAEMRRQQAESIARAEASWPPAKYKWVNGVKVYDSYADYCR